LQEGEYFFNNEFVAASGAFEGMVVMFKMQ